MKTNIAIYPGSFNPFHKGHYDILLKAESIFDKVIIARGVNADKSNHKKYELPDKIKDREIKEYSGLLTDFMDSLEYEVTVIRGLRNSTDLQYEMTQYRFLQDLKPNIKVISIFCDKEYEHISSSAIRMLELYGKEKQYLL
jgi:pantetheine-phosphate adenylyltransferase